MIVNPSSIDIGLKAAHSANIPRENVIVIGDSVDGFIGIKELIRRGKTLPAVERIVFAPGEAKRRLAFLSFSSGTSGLPKGVMISHANLVANLCQAYEVERHNPHNDKKRVACGVLPFYHSMFR
jgi:acyl-CoA synthetase (AMP-forming)/AMP-acid ligase II